MAASANIAWAVETALARGLDLDFHIDYDLAADETPLAWTVVTELLRQDWVGKAAPGRTVVLGHGTRLTQVDYRWMRALKAATIKARLPLHFVGLPTSDLFMMGRLPYEPEGTQSRTPKWSSRNWVGRRLETSFARLRGTLPVPALIKEWDLNACLGANNVGNAFTPYGTGDPLSLASWGVGLYHAGTVEDAELLYSCVSWRARRAVGLEQGNESEKLEEGQRWRPMLLIRNREFIEVGARVDGEDELTNPDTNLPSSIKVPARQRLAVKDVVWDPQR